MDALIFRLLMVFPLPLNVPLNGFPDAPIGTQLEVNVILAVNINVVFIYGVPVPVLTVVASALS